MADVTLDPDTGTSTGTRREIPASTQVRLVAGVTARELARRPGGWVATLLTAVLFAGLIGAVGLSAANTQNRVEARSFAVAVSGDLDGAASTIDALRADQRLVITPTDDAANLVTEGRASSGVEFPPNTDARVASGETVELRLFSRDSNPVSTESFNTLGLRLQEIELERVAAVGGLDQVPRGAEVEIRQLGRDEEAARLEFARQLAPVGALLCIGVVTAVASVLGQARERRSIEPLLVLPIRRDAIAGGISAGAYPLGAVQLIAGVALLVATVAIPGSALHQPTSVVISMLVAGSAAACLLALVATAFGCLAGALGTGSDDAVSMGDLVSVVFVVVGVATYIVPGLDAPHWYLVPVLGQTLVLRDAIDGSATVGPTLLAAITAVAVFVLVVRLAGRRLGADRANARSSS